jgi:hypothetical protein
MPAPSQFNTDGTCPGRWTRNEAADPSWIEPRRRSPQNTGGNHEHQ